MRGLDHLYKSAQPTFFFPWPRPTSLSQAQSVRPVHYRTSGIGDQLGWFRHKSAAKWIIDLVGPGKGMARSTRVIPSQANLILKGWPTLPYTLPINLNMILSYTPQIVP